MSKRRITVLALLLVSTALWAQERGGLNEAEYQAYVTLQSRETPFEKKLEAVALFKQNYTETRSVGILLAVTDLLRFRYDVANFKEENNAMFYDDRVAEELIRILIESRDPRGFEVLVAYVSKRNHRLATLNAAWAAIQNIDWNLGAQM